MSEEMQQDVAFEQTEEQEDNGMAEQPEQTEDAQQTTEDAVEAVEATTDADAEAVEAEGDDNDNADMDEIDDDTEDDRKLFVGGISWESTVKDLREHFEKFGKVVHCTLKTDYVSHKSRGFGFVSFASPESVEKVLNAKEPHKLHGRTIDPKKAEPRPKKIFVGKLDPDTPQEDVSAYFSKFGEVEKMEFPFDKTKEKRRAFCFVEFKKMSAFKKCLEETSHKIKTQEVDVKKATLQQTNSGMRGGQRGGRGFGPNSRGGRGGGFQGQYGYNQNNYYPTYYDPNAGFYDQQGYYNDGSYYGNNYYSGWNGGGGYQGYSNNNYYGYEDWGNGQGGGNNSNFGKSQKRGGSQAFHPYNR